LAPALIALGAQVRIVGPRAEDESLLPLEQLFRTPRHEGQRETVLAPKQFVAHVILPPAERESGTYEVRHGAGPDYPIAAAAAALVLDAGRFVREARIVMGHVAPIPWVSEEAARQIIGKFVDHAVAEAAGKAAVAQATPLAHNGYKVQLARVAVKRAILLAAGLETGGF
jgi:xanthine dehydrogenase YagS FAD-binding subunit